MTFTFATASRIIFGPRTSDNLGTYAKEFGSPVLLVHGRSGERMDAIAGRLKEAGVRSVSFQVAHEPTVESVDQAASLARGEHCRAVVAVGGGSVLDAGKAAAALAVNPGNVREYLEVIGKGKALTQKPLPLIALPTTAGTGSEVTKNAVIGSPADGVKVSLRSDFMYPALAVVDPILTHSLPRELTITTGLDALTQLVEAFVSGDANPLTSALSREGIIRAWRALPRAVGNGKDAEAREEMSLASLLSGIVLANAKLGAVHGFAGPLGGMTGAAHGALCAALLPAVLEANAQALISRAPDSPEAARFEELAGLLTGHVSARAAESSERVRTLCASWAVPGLRQLGFRPADFKTAVEKAKKASSMQGNPIQLTDEELHSILEASY
ncbi:MAG TPA: iron-containing alcohol dehydrogenase [Spirochaetia bacterium]|nr:iron-containing alcohol dehydrogenase [Spirochaetia bacterium]